MLRNFPKVTKLAGGGAGTSARKDGSKVHAICTQVPVTATPRRMLSAQGRTRGWHFLREGSKERGDMDVSGQVTEHVGNSTEIHTVYPETILKIHRIYVSEERRHLFLTGEKKCGHRKNTTGSEASCSHKTSEWDPHLLK